MRPGDWFTEISKSLADGFFADNVVLALARVKRDLSVAEFDAGLFRRASTLLADAISGYRWIDKPTFTGDSANHANLFGQAVRALTIASAPADFVAHLEDLEKAAEQLAERQVPNPDELGKLRHFFANHARAEMEQSDRLFAPKTRGWSNWKAMA